ncbi:hypothetical protein Cylst_4204 [Cylindrospermum stagnale PCC 7417]|uniref:Uncharacterized protein n=1 Tax=Cylindrospermum stagnale PCC 7417 TaxID=56107 RepID=K9X1E2_9NOST|nr:hypothetical protein [Cylindrospermum stagnale]AFZ26303.1 hypothetical protein Cylst_4204 [Cylindrospermum stagnale PCC 7417]
MSVEQILLQNVAANSNFHPVTKSEVKQEPAKSDGLNVPDLVISLTPLSFIFSWAILLLALRKLRTNLDNKMVFTINSLQQVPCKNCRFFSNNHYLKCAVKPDTVLTEEAINCQEYSPKKGKFPPKNFFG